MSYNFDKSKTMTNLDLCEELELEVITFKSPGTDDFIRFLDLTDDNIDDICMELSRIFYSSGAEDFIGYPVIKEN